MPNLYLRVEIYNNIIYYIIINLIVLIYILILINIYISIMILIYIYILVSGLIQTYNISIRTNMNLRLLNHFLQSLQM